MKITKGILLSTVIICFIVFFSLTALAQTGKPIKIGVVYTFSGPTAMLCNSILAGHKIAGEEINKAGGLLGRKIEFIVRDDAGNPELTTRYCRELITKEEVDFILAGHGSIPTMAAQAVANQFKKPTFLFGGHADRTHIEDMNPYSFRFSITTTAEGRMAAKLVKEEVLKGVNNPTVYWISWDYEYGRSLHKPFMARIKETMPDVKIVGEAWPRTGETDYGPFISQMLATKPSVIVNAIWGGGVVSLLKQSKQMGVFERSKLISMALIGSIEYRQVIGMDMPEGTWSHTYDDVIWPNNEGQRKFYQLYREFAKIKADEPVPSHASCGYYVGQLVAAAIKKAGTTEAEAVCKAMEGITIDTYWGPLKVRDFDHQVIPGNIWAPMIKKPGLPYLVFDASRAQYVSIENDLPGKEEWLARRKAAGK